MLKHVPEVNALDFLHGLKIYACICIFFYWGTVDFKYTIKILLSCFIGYLCLSFVVCDFGGDELSGRMTGAIYATGLGQTAAVTCFYVVYYSVFKKLSLIKTMQFLALPFIVIVLTQSRNSMAMMGIAVLAYIIVYTRGHGASKRVWGLFFLGVCVAVAGYNVFVHSGFAARILNVSEAYADSWQYNNLATGTVFDKIVGDRLIYYVLGFRLFLKNPLTGIGMWNYKYVTDGVYPLHSEYMIHLCEGGLVATFLWTVFIAYIIKGVVSYLPKGKFRTLAFFSVMQLLFCAVYARLFYSEFFYPLVGITLSLIYMFKSEKVKNIRYDQEQI